MPADFSDFERLSLTFDRETRTVYRAGTGPAVVVMHEIPGLHPGVVRFGRVVRDAGCNGVILLRLAFSTLVSEAAEFREV